MARRRATKQLLRVPWDRFRKAHAAYPRWLAFTLWTDAILAAEGNAPSWLLATLKKRCPDLIDKEAFSMRPGPLALRLQEWVHKKIFREAKELGWLDALMFFGVRDLRSQATWAYWEHCEEEWERRRPRSYPPFERWWQKARNCRFCQKASAAQITTALERYVEVQAIAYWLQPLFEASEGLPAAVAVELGRRCPGFLGFINSVALGEQETKGKVWRRLARWTEGHYFAEAKKQGWFDIVVRQARNDPRHVRAVEFWKRSKQSWSLNSAILYPSFSQWCRMADSYVED